MDNETILAETIALKQLLARTDYQALKHADGALSDDEYSEIKAQRQEWRTKINELEAQITEEAE